MRALLVGGFVRDTLLGKNPHDRDYVVEGETVEEMLKKGFTQVGEDFPVFLHPVTKDEYALARTERKIGSGYHGFETNHSADVTLEEDLFRRDLTINAMAFDKDGSLIDPYNGLEDLENGILRHVSIHFQEDPVRVLRIVRFAARYGFKIADETLSLIVNMVEKGDLKHLQAERVNQEVDKGLMESTPVIMFDLMRENNIDFGLTFSDENFKKMKDSLSKVAINDKTILERKAILLFFSNETEEDFVRLKYTRDIINLVKMIRTIDLSIKDEREILNNFKISSFHNVFDKNKQEVEFIMNFLFSDIKRIEKTIEFHNFKSSHNFSEEFFDGIVGKDRFIKSNDFFATKLKEILEG